MRRIAITLAVASIIAVCDVSAQTSVSEINGKVLDPDGKPIPGAEISAQNKSFKDQLLKGTSDKRGNFSVPGLLYTATALKWTVTITAPGFVPVKAHIVARGSNRTLYMEDNAKLSAKTNSFEVTVHAFSEVRVEYTMRPGDAEAEAAPPPPPPPPEPVAPVGEGAPGAAAAIPGIPGAAPGAPPANDSYGQAAELVRNGKAEDSVDLFKKAIEEKPDDWERRTTFARVLLGLDRQGEATIQANKAAQIAPDKAGPYVALTDIYLARGLSDKAAEAIAKAQQLEPDNMKVLERAAAVDANAGKLDEAIALNEKVLAMKPDNTEVMVALADLYNRKKQPKKAEEILDRIKAADPKNAYRTFYNLGVVIENRDDATEADHRKAMAAFRQAIELKPDYAVAHRDLGIALIRTGDLAEARKELQKYVDLAPTARDVGEIKGTIKSIPSVH